MGRPLGKGRLDGRVRYGKSAAGADALQNLAEVRTRVMVVRASGCGFFPRRSLRSLPWRSWVEQLKVLGMGKLCESFNLKRAVEPTQRRQGAETQGFRLVVGAITHWVSYANLFFPGHLPVPYAFASWRLGVNCRF